MDIKIKKRNGRLEDFNVEKINACAQRACQSISDVSASEIVPDAQLQLYDKITTSVDRPSLNSFSKRKDRERAGIFIRS